jgi:uncharacterized membrane protein
MLRNWFRQSWEDALKSTYWQSARLLGSFFMPASDMGIFFAMQGGWRPILFPLPKSANSHLSVV